MSDLKYKANYNQIRPRDSLFDLKLDEIWRYRDLLVMFVRRDFVAYYKQTILGPLWFFIQPLLTTIVFTVIFGNVAKIPTDGLPPALFYMAGVTVWNYFAECFKSTSESFIKHANLFEKVYFPRVILPLSEVISQLIRFAIQMLMFLGFLFYYVEIGAEVKPNLLIILFPFLVIIMGILGLSFGMIISALTSKYRDLKFLVQFGVQLMMYAAPVIYPVSEIPDKYRWLIMANPMTSIIETFRYSFIGRGTLSWSGLGYSAIFAIALFFFAFILFNRTEKNFMDTV